MGLERGADVKVHHKDTKSTKKPERFFRWRDCIDFVPFVSLWFNPSAER